MGTLHDQNLSPQESSDQKIAAGLRAAAKVYFKETRDDLYQAVGLFVDHLITAAVNEQDTYVFLLYVELSSGFDDVPGDCFNGKLLDFVKQLFLSGQLEVPDCICFCLDESHPASKVNDDLDLYNLWQVSDVYAVLLEALEEKLFLYLGKEQTQQLNGYPEHLIRSAPCSFRGIIGLD
ncbi:MAG: hypothetical protein WCK64_05920 [Synechococcaceae cyanobacterium ELA445]|jgi:hypothetical protein